MKDLTAERAAAERVIRECPEVWNRVCYLSDCTFQALATRILEYGQQTRQEALREAEQAIFQLIDGRGLTAIQVLEAQTKIKFAFHRLASEGG